MSAPAVEFRALRGPAELAAWDALAEGPLGSMRQCSWWASPLEGYGVQVDVVGGFRDRELVGGALVRSIRLPGVGRSIAECLGGPILVDPDDDAADGLVASLSQLGERRRFIQLAVRYCPDPAARTALTTAMERAGLRTTTAPELPEAVIDLRHDHLDAVVGRYRDGARRALARARRAGVVVEQLREPADLRAAHQAFQASARRKGFADLRPWAAMRPLLEQSTARGAGEVLGVRDGSEVVAAIYVARSGTDAEYIYGGYLDRASRSGANHALHHEAIQRAARAGRTAYRLGMLVDVAQPTGIDRFKLSLGPQTVTVAPAITWTRLPPWGALIRIVRDTGRAGRLAAGLRRHRVRTAEARRD